MATIEAIAHGDEEILLRFIHPNFLPIAKYDNKHSINFYIKSLVGKSISSFHKIEVVPFEQSEFPGFTFSVIPSHRISCMTKLENDTQTESSVFLVQHNSKWFIVFPNPYQKPEACK